MTDEPDEGWRRWLARRRAALDPARSLLIPGVEWPANDREIDQLQIDMLDDVTDD